MKSEIQQVLKELSLESFAIVIGSLLNLNSGPSLFLEECIFVNVETRDRGKPALKLQITTKAKFSTTLRSNIERLLLQF